MTSKLTITNERLAELVAFKPLPGTDITSATRDEWMAMAAELQERRKAERDSEPVAYMTYKGYLLHAGDPKLAEYSEPTPLYADPRAAAMPAAPVAWLWSRDDERDVSLTPPDDDDDAADAIECGWTATPLYRRVQQPVDNTFIPKNLDKALGVVGVALPESKEEFNFQIKRWIQRLIDRVIRYSDEFKEQPALVVPDREHVRREHAEWSHVTFGNVGPVGPLKHLSKEALEAAAEPNDLSEWADMQFLMWDAQRRAGITDEQITQAMIEKLVVNKQRSWPEPKEGEPRLHIKEQPAQVVPEKATVGEMPFLGTSEGVYVRGWNDCRAAMLKAQPQNAPQNIPEIIPGWIPVSERMPEERETVVLVADERGVVWCAEVQDGEIYPDEFPGTRGFGCSEATHWMPLPAAPQEVNHG